MREILAARKAIESPNGGVCPCWPLKACFLVLNQIGPVNAAGLGMRRRLARIVKAPQEVFDHDGTDLGESSFYSLVANARRN
jgi:hypothetical protein